MLSVTSFELEKKKVKKKKKKTEKRETNKHTHTQNFYLIEPCLLSITVEKTRKKKYIYNNM
jgi:hypothetical protein